MKTELLKRPFIPALRVITKPFDSFEAIKEKQLGAVWQISIPIILLFLVRIFNLVFGGFLFNTTDVKSVNLLVEFITILSIYVLFVFANKNFCDLTDGDGTIIEVALVTSYSLIPYIITSFINFILSNVFVMREAAFMQIVSVAGLLWTLLIGLVGLKSVHRYSFGKTVITLFVTLIFMAFIAFLCALIFLVTQQVVLFIKDIYNEIIFRM